MAGLGQVGRRPGGVDGDAVGEGQAGVDLLQAAIGEEAVEAADRVVARRAPRVGEVEDAVGIEDEVVGAVERLALVRIDQGGDRLVRRDLQDAVDLVALVGDVEIAVPVERQPGRESRRC